MRGLTVDAGWTHLLPGMIIAGVGAGFVNTPLAATAVGVVEPTRAGMASGINTTLRQVGTATGVAVLGAIFATHLHVSSPIELRAGVVDGLNEILLVAAATAAVGAVAAALLIRRRDFVDPRLSRPGSRESQSRLRPRPEGAH